MLAFFFYVNNAGLHLMALFFFPLSTSYYIDFKIQRIADKLSHELWQCCDNGNNFPPNKIGPDGEEEPEFLIEFGIFPFGKGFNVNAVNCLFFYDLGIGLDWIRF